MDEDQILQSIIADPELTDPSIDVSQLRQTTPTRTELLANVPEFSGLKFDPTQRSYIEDLYTLYGGGLPMVSEPVVETPVVTTPIVDPSVMDQPADDSVLDATPVDTTPTDTFAGQPVGSITPGTTIDNVTGDITNPDGTYGGNIVDEVALTGAAPGGVTGDPIDVGIPDVTGFVDPLGTEGGAPVVSPVLTNIGPVEGTVDPKFPDDKPLTDVELAEEGFKIPISDVRPPGFEPTITAEDTPETFIDKAKDFLNLDKIDIPKFIISSAINAAVGKPITIAFDIAKDLFDKSKEEGVTADDAFDVDNEAAFAGFDAGGFDPATPVDTPTAPVDNIFDEVALTGGGGDSDPAPTGGGSDFGGFDSGGFDPAPEPDPAPTPTTDFYQDPITTGGSGAGGPSGGKSIVCTAMYQTTGLEDWKKAMKIWYIYQKKYLTIQHQEGYHKLFKPFVKGMHKSKIIKAIGAHVAKHRTQHLKHIMFNSKPSLLGKIYNKILEPICYWVGKHD